MQHSARALANRRNAKRSTGPKSLEGKQRVARNAMSYGLSLPITDETDDTTLAAAKLLAEQAGSSCIEAAQKFIAAQNRLLLIRNIRGRLFQEMDDHLTGKIDPERDRRMLKAFVYDSGLTLKQLGMALPVLNRPLREVLREITNLDRYERRALTRRRDAARQLQEIAPIAGKS